jgi:hypothetical protein
LTKRAGATGLKKGTLSPTQMENGAIFAALLDRCLFRSNCLTSAMKRWHLSSDFWKVTEQDQQELIDALRAFDRCFDELLGFGDSQSSPSTGKTTSNESQKDGPDGSPKTKRSAYLTLARNLSDFRLNGRCLPELDGPRLSELSGPTSTSTAAKSKSAKAKRAPALSG